MPGIFDCTVFIVQGSISVTFSLYPVLFVIIKAYNILIGLLLDRDLILFLVYNIRVLKGRLF